MAPGQWWLRAVIALGPPAALLCTSFVGAVPAWWLVILVVALSLVFAAVPEGPVGTVAFVVVIAWWGVSLRDGLHPQAIAAACALVAAHVAAVLASYGPALLQPDRPTVLLWVRRGCLVALVAPLVWALAALVRDQPEPPGIWVAGLVGALGAAVAASAARAAGADD
ncbi:hypothetical protein H5V45_17200 [Nocardioides sp. KIGAM211]|uniref:Uncharacterized protein n=1 Tax=Nocardioides luti TaxID=2761101 RepID=A0A7X0VCJ1_9ACTN|nr:hypothetical protein [Nocardioides luti]MBB6629067.1 hypothetical protein [Nocardioides luti]